MSLSSLTVLAELVLHNLASGGRAVTPLFAWPARLTGLEGQAAVGLRAHFSDGRWVRYHPGADLIWSTETLPSKAMRHRYNRAAKLQRHAEQEAEQAAWT